MTLRADFADFRAFAASLEAAWSSATPDQFPALASDALTRAAFHQSVTFADLLELLCDPQAPPLPRQLDPSGTFGDPPFTLYFGTLLALDIYFWHQPEVAIHNHSFHGAFTVLEGCSLHTHFAFTPSQQWPGLQIGELKSAHIELLKKGDVRPITAGTTFIHQVAHLSSPCVSLVVRTLPRAGDPPIYDFLKPHCALLQQRHLSEQQMKRIALAGLLHRIGRADALKKLLDAAQDVEVAWALRLTAIRAQDLAISRAIASQLEPRPWFEAFFESLQMTDRAVFNWSTLKIEAHRLTALLLHEIQDPKIQQAILDAYEPGFTIMSRLQKWAATNGCEDLFGLPLPYESALVLSALLEGHSEEEACRRVAAHQGHADPQPFAGFVAQMKAFFLSHPWLGPLISRV